MLIDWFTVAAQVLNFLILVALLKRFLYQPILDAIDAREQQIAARLADARASQQRAREAQEGYQQQAAELAAQRAELVRQAREQAAGQAARLLQEARSQADELARGRRQALDAEYQALRDAIVQRTVRAVFTLLRKILADLAQAPLEPQICARFIARLRTLDAAALEKLRSATASGTASVRSAVELAPPERDALQRAVDEVCARHVALRFEAEPDLISGIALEAGGYRLAWDVADYLTQLEDGVAAGAAPGAAPAASSP